MTVPPDGELDWLRGELARLRGENARLARLLDLRGQDTTPAPEQLAASRPQGLVTRASSVEDKLALYADVFRARTDVYALYWENLRQGRRGWMPAVAGGWRKTMKDRSARHLPLTREVVSAHLSKGDVFIGLYPLLRDNSCHFVVADFDGQAAMLDALSYAKAARAEGVPSAVELSKSGRGAHVWVFFAEAVAGATARQLGAALLHEAMLLRGTMDLRSYDRLFPNQDVLPDGGFGNLIAAPLEGSRRDAGLTVFLDLSTLEPCVDQWEFLSTLDRLSPSTAVRLARRAKQTAVGLDVTAVPSSAATQVQPRMPVVVRADLAAKLIMDTDQLTPAAVTTFKHAASLANPRFYELQRLRKSTWDTPRFIRGYDVTVDDRLVLPRGLRHRVVEILERSGSQLIMTDSRNQGGELDLSFTGELKPEQATAVSAMLAYDDGVLMAPPGSGKTVMACALIAERATATLILVDRKALADQWRARVAEFLGGLRPGQHGGGRKKLTGMIDIAMLPSLARREDVAALTGSYGHVVVDECHHVAAAAYEHSVGQIGAQFWLGLTATPSRRDGLDDLVVWQLGPVRHALAQASENTLLDVADGPTAPNRELYLHQTSLALEELDSAAPVAIAEAHRALVGDEQRNLQIVDDVERAVSRGRNCLVLTRRLAHVEILARMLSERGHQPLVLQGGMPAKERRAVVDRITDARAGEGLLVIGTTPFIGEGFDAPALDTLFLAAPIAYDGLLVQCVGRVIRAAAGKNTTEVHDYHDAGVPLLAGALRRRRPGYRALGFTMMS